MENLSVNIKKLNKEREINGWEIGKDYLDERGGDERKKWGKDEKEERRKRKDKGEKERGKRYGDSK